MNTKISIIGRINLMAVLALGVAASASAQSMSTSSAAPPTGPDTGLLGTTYAQANFGYQKEDVGIPDVLHDYDLIYNQSLFRAGGWGTDLNLTYDYLTGGAYGIRDYRNEGEVGLTEYLAESWGDPFVTADGGGAWQHAANVARKSFAYSFTGGVQFRVAPNFFLTPFAEYQAEPSLYNHEIPFAYYPDHDWDYGVKATYRFTPRVSLSLGADMDQYSRDDLGYTAGLAFRF
jgi:hypothetical protein